MTFACRSVQRNRRPISASTKADQGAFNSVLSILRDKKSELFLKLLKDILAVVLTVLQRVCVATEQGFEVGS
jgi:hypothetical protein